MRNHFIFDTLTDPSKQMFGHFQYGIKKFIFA